jgi:hypothetical protein
MALNDCYALDSLAWRRLFLLEGNLARIRRDIINLGIREHSWKFPKHYPQCQRTLILRGVFMKFSKDDHQLVADLGLRPRPPYQ